MCTCNAPEIDSAQRAKIDEIINAHKQAKGSLIPVLHEVQLFYGYLPYEVLKIIAAGMELPMSDVFGVVSFYAGFTTKPVGKYKIAVCMGTACYVVGAEKILNKFEDLLSIKAGESTEDLLFTIEAVRCVGACGLAPVIIVNEDVFGKLKVDGCEGVLDNYRN